MDVNEGDFDLDRLNALNADIQGYFNEPVVVAQNQLIPFPMQNRLLGENEHENTCFMNVVIQALYHLKPFRDLIQGFDLDRLVNKHNDYVFLKDFKEIFNPQTPSDVRLENVKALQRTFNFEEGQQANFVDFLDAIIQKLSSIPQINLDAFRFQYRVIQRNGHTPQETKLFFFELTGEAKEFISMQACLNGLTEVKAKNNVFNHQIFFNGTPPEALSFYLGNGAPLCIETSIKINFRLQKPKNNKYVNSPQNSIYELYAVIIKLSSEGNHFHCYARNSSSRGSTWHLFNDESVTLVPDNDIVVALRGKQVSHVFYKLTSDLNYFRDVKNELVNNLWYDDMVNEVVSALNKRQNIDRRGFYVFDTTESAVIQQKLPTNTLWVSVICKLLEKPLIRTIRSQGCGKQISHDDYVHHLPNILVFVCHVAHNVILLLVVELPTLKVYVLNYFDFPELNSLVHTFLNQLNTLHNGNWNVSHIKTKKVLIPEHTAGECVKKLRRDFLSVPEAELNDPTVLIHSLFDMSLQQYTRGKPEIANVPSVFNFWVSVYDKVKKKNAQPKPKNVATKKQKQQPQKQSPNQSQTVFHVNQASGSSSGSTSRTVKGLASPDVENYDAYREFAYSDESVIRNFENIKTLDEACKQIHQMGAGQNEEEEEEEEKEEDEENLQEEKNEEQKRPKLSGGSGSRSRKNVVVVYLNRSTRREKKYMALVNGKTVHFGARGMSDYTKHHDKERLKRYLLRHRAHENWTKKGMATAGFWSRWLLWNKPSKRESIRDIENRFHILIRH